MLRGWKTMEINFQEQLKNFMNEDGKLKQFPGKRKYRKIVYFFLVSKFEHDVIYTEKEVNEILNQHHTFNDSCMLRRELYNMRFLDRKKDGSEYWLEKNQPDLEEYLS